MIAENAGIQTIKLFLIKYTNKGLKMNKILKQLYNQEYLKLENIPMPMNKRIEKASYIAYMRFLKEHISIIHVK